MANQICLSVNVFSGMIIGVALGSAFILLAILTILLYICRQRSVLIFKNNSKRTNFTLASLNTLPRGDTPVSTLSRNPQGQVKVWGLPNKLRGFVTEIESEPNYILEVQIDKCSEMGFCLEARGEGIVVQSVDRSKNISHLKYLEDGDLILGITTIFKGISSDEATILLQTLSPYNSTIYIEKEDHYNKELLHHETRPDLQNASTSPIMETKEYSKMELPEIKINGVSPTLLKQLDPSIGDLPIDDLKDNFYSTIVNHNESSFPQPTLTVKENIFQTDSGHQVYSEFENQESSPTKINPIFGLKLMDEDEYSLDDDNMQQIERSINFDSDDNRKEIKPHGKKVRERRHSTSSVESTFEENYVVVSDLEPGETAYVARAKSKLKQKSISFQIPPKISKREEDSDSDVDRRQPRNPVSFGNVKTLTKEYNNI